MQARVQPRPKNPDEVILNNGILSSLSIGKVFKDFVRLIHKERAGE